MDKVLLEVVPVNISEDQVPPKIHSKAGVCKYISLKLHSKAGVGKKINSWKYLTYNTFLVALPQLPFTKVESQIDPYSLGKVMIEH